MSAAWLSSSCAKRALEKLRTCSALCYLCKRPTSSSSCRSALGRNWRDTQDLLQDTHAQCGSRDGPSPGIPDGRAVKNGGAVTIIFKRFGLVAVENVDVFIDLP